MTPPIAEPPQIFATASVAVQARGFYLYRNAVPNPDAGAIGRPRTGGGKPGRGGMRRHIDAGFLALRKSILMLTVIHESWLT